MADQIVVPGKRGTDPIGDFAACLRELRGSVGEPSFRTLATRSGCISHTTLHEATQGNRMPSWETTEQFVLACGGDPGQWRERWEQAAAEVERIAQEQEAVGSPASPVPTGRPSGATPASPRSPGGPRAATSPLSPGAPAPAAATAGSVAVVDPASGSADDESVAAMPLVHPEQDEAAAPARRDDPPAADRGELVPAPDTPARNRPRAGLLGLAAAALLLVGSGIGFGAGYLAHDGGQAAAADEGSGEPGDVIEPPQELTLPDGTVVQPGSTVTKTWKLSNQGSVPWTDRSLQRVTPAGATGATCETPDHVAIPQTPPGSASEVSIDIVVPDASGETCRVEWKMVGADGEPSFPEGRPLFFYLKIA